MTKKFDIQVTITALAQHEKAAEEIVGEFLKLSQMSFGQPDVIDWELVEFVPSELAQSCCC